MVNSLPNDKIFDLTKLKAFADDKLNIAIMTFFCSDRVENTVGKGENAGHQHFLRFPHCFPKPSSLGSLKVGIVWERVKKPDAIGIATCDRDGGIKLCIYSSGSLCHLYP